MNEFVLSILEKRKPLVDVAQALNMTVGGIVAHQSAMRDGELLKVPHYSLNSQTTPVSSYRPEGLRGGELLKHL